MNKVLSFSCLLVLMIFLYQSCEKWDLAQEDFIAVEFTKLDPLSINSVQLTGEIKDLRIGQISEHGFVWTTQTSTPTLFDNEGSSLLGVKDVEDPSSFSADLEDLFPASRYTFRAFATLEGEIKYSEPTVWESGTGMVATDSTVYNGGRNLDIFGSINGMGAGLLAVSHGFCWSIENKVPDLSDNFKDFGLQRDNLSFSHTIFDLENDTPVYFRAFAVLRHPANFELDTLYGQRLVFDGDLFEVWEQKAEFIGDFSGGHGFSINDKGYVLDYNFDFWEYNPETNSWSQEPSLLKTDADYIFTSFSISDKGYLLADNGEFWEYNPQTRSWTSATQFNGFLDVFTGFSIEDKGYVIDYLGDFWEYNPQMGGSWTEKANFGIGACGSGVSFSINGLGYVCLGYCFGEGVITDFWEYNPLTDNWTQRADFGGGARLDATGFSINSKGYVGLGNSEPFAFQEGFSDFWEYAPQSDSWTQRADFGGGNRFSAIGFSINNKGYIGMGSFASPVAQDFVSFNDFWEYDPK